MKIEIDDDVAEGIIRQELIQTYIWLKEDRKKAKEGRLPNIFSLEPKEDAKILKKKMKAFDAVIEYYSTIDEYAAFCRDFK